MRILSKSFNWEDKTLYKGEGQKLSLWSFALLSLIGFGIWFTLGGYHILWVILSHLLQL